MLLRYIAGQKTLKFLLFTFSFLHWLFNQHFIFMQRELIIGFLDSIEDIHDYDLNKIIRGVVVDEYSLSVSYD